MTNILNNNLIYSKYIYKNNEIDTNTYIFELLLKDKDYNSKIIRCIKNNKQGKLVTSNDNILYENIDNYKLSFVDIINPNKSIIINEYIDHKLSSNVYINKKIYLEINKINDKLLNMNYRITV
jgi:hypothetical protein